MKLLCYIMKHTERLSQILSGFMEAGIPGTTVIDSQGALQVLGADSVNAPPIFGALRRFLNPDGEPEKMILVILPEEKVEAAKSVIRSVVDLSQPDTGVVFTIPVSDVEGLSDHV